MESSTDRGERSPVSEKIESPAGHGLELDTEEMRRLGHRVVDLIVDRWADLRNAPSWQGGTRRELEPLLAGAPPEEGQSPDEVLARVVRDVLPRAGRIDHPRFFAFIPSSPTWPSVLGDFLATGYNVFQGTWLESAGPSQLELVVMEWFRDWLGYPDTGGGLLTSGGSAANLVALVTAREWAGDPSDPVLYLSDQGHSSLERAARIIGLPVGNVRKLPTDSSFRMDLAALREAIREDRERGLRPLCLSANGGATNTGAVDPLQEMGAVARQEGLWFHVDAAYGGFAVLTPVGRKLLEGLELADSVTLDPHKWLFQPYETGCLMVRDTRVLEKAFRILPEYLQDVNLGREQVNFADRGIQLTRGFRALKIWVSIQTLGLAAFREAIQRGIDLAEAAQEYIEASPVLEMLGPASLGIVCFRFTPDEVDLDEKELEDLNVGVQHDVVGTGLAMTSSTRLRGTYSLRLSILNYRSTWEDVRATLAGIEEIGRRRTGERVDS
jgi:glutamate/tyrosine decarboxylase-like PLP-dependent enzyme